MKIKLQYLFVPVVLVCFQISEVCAIENVVELRADPWCPYNCSDAEPSKPGVLIEIAQFAFQKHGYKVHYKNLNWSRAIDSCRAGDVDGIVGAYVEDARDFVFPKVALAFATEQVFVLADSPLVVKNKNSLKGQKIGVIQDYTYDKVSTKLIKDKDPAFFVLSGEEPLPSLIKMLLAGRLSGVLENPHVFRNVISEMKIDSKKFKSAGNVFFRKTPVYIAFSPKNKKSKMYSRWLSDEVNAMNIDGRMKALLKKYEIHDWIKVSL